jgi:aryl-alcohol dehydrogenase-like predicted oxidoreductase
MALPENTASYFSKFPHIKSKILGKTRFHSSICGFGCYRIDDGNSKHYKALETALLSGINLIDTSSNYSDGGSELLIGKVLAKLIEKKELGIEREKEGIGFKDVVKCSPDLWHCISPDFLENQITLSLKRLQLIKIDVYLLHNPEYYLTYSLISDPERREKEYYKRIKEAFIQLEKEVEQGRISYYGISSNTFGEKILNPISLR